MTNGDDPFRQDDGNDWGTAQPPTDGDIDMNYGQPLPDPLQASPPQQQLQRTKPKLDNDDIIAMVVSVFLPGVGHMMLGQAVKGIVILGVSMFTCGGFGLLWFAVILDAYLVAMTRKYRDVGDWEILPDASQHLQS